MVNPSVRPTREKYKWLVLQPRFCWLNPAIRHWNIEDQTTKADNQLVDFPENQSKFLNPKECQTHVYIYIHI